MKKNPLFKRLANFGAKNKKDANVISVSKIVHQGKENKKERQNSPLFNKANKKYKLSVDHKKINKGEMKESLLFPKIESLSKSTNLNVLKHFKEKAKILKENKECKKVLGLPKSYSCENIFSENNGNKNSPTNHTPTNKNKLKNSFNNVSLPKRGSLVLSRSAVSFHLESPIIKNKPTTTKNRRKSMGFLSNHILSKLYGKELKKVSGMTHPGTNMEGEEKINQDSFLLLQNIFGCDFNILAVLDGHGENGHLVSNYCKSAIEQFFSNQANFMSKNSLLMNITEDIIYSRLTLNNYKMIKKFYELTDLELSKLKFDTSFSGTTCVMVFYVKHHIICSNVGDSRAVIFSSRSRKSNFTFKNLSYDHKPGNSKEKLRIEAKGGSVEQFKNEEGEEEGPLRVCAKHKTDHGLAVSRSLGDSALHQFGVSSEPDITEIGLLKEYKILIMGSDGLWDVMNQDNICNCLKDKRNSFDASEISTLLIEKAVNKWGEISRDDITCITFVLNDFDF
ncbi:MAG: protein phosphatase 2C domain-containing protein [archaeon]|nr:protein phosphatase 2C domain-containing protein [archaeon]